MATQTDQAREQVIAARQGLVDAAAGMRRSAVEAVNLPAKAKDDPVRFGALAVATAFVALGGPRRVLGRIRRAIFGTPPPTSLLPKEIEKAVEGMGRDSEVVKRRLEREFADYLEEHREQRKRTMVTGTVLGVASSFVSAFSQRAAKQLAARLFEPRSSRDQRSARETKPASTSSASRQGFGGKQKRG